MCDDAIWHHRTAPVVSLFRKRSPSILSLCLLVTEHWSTVIEYTDSRLIDSVPHFSLHHSMLPLGALLTVL
jgi:hypothetical protein